MIETSLHGLEQVFAWVLQASWQASVLVLIILISQRALRRWLNPRWHHALWLLVIARLVLPVLPSSSFSVFQFAPSTTALGALTLSGLNSSAVPAMPPVAATPAIVPPLASYPFSAFTALAIVWLSAVSVLLGRTCRVNLRFARHVRKAPAVSDPRVRDLAESVRCELGIRRAPRIIESAQVQNPVLVGLVYPALILPLGARERFSTQELRFIFLHEFAHLKRGDLILQWLVALLQIVHWFNPVLMYAFRRMRIDREPATDALVLSRAGEEQKESYGQVLVKLLEHYQVRRAFPTWVGILEDKDQIRRRISLIVGFTRNSHRWSVFGVVVMSLLALTCLTNFNRRPQIISSSMSHTTNGANSVKRDVVASTFWMKLSSPQNPVNAEPQPFYAALPFNDLAHPDVAQKWLPGTWRPLLVRAGQPHSVCIHRWLKITNQKGVSCYAQWEAIGPECDDDAEYVFGNKPPKVGKDGHSDGIDLSPGAAAFLSLDSQNRIVSWQFVDQSKIPPGPWLSRSANLLLTGDPTQRNLGN